PLGLVAVPLLLLGLVSFGRLGRRLPGLGVLPAVGLAVLLAAVFVTNGSAATRDTVERARTFFGSYRVESRDGVHTLVHGTTIHGTQFTDQQRRDLPTTYYSRGGPLGEVFGLDEGRFDRVGAVGLGTGTVAAYGRPGQTMTFFEIDPDMVRMARDTSLFTYLADSAAEIETVVGDGRLTVSAREPGSLDLLVLDAFSSDSIPIHLLTAEAMRMYASRLADDGVLAVHVSNRVFELEPVVAAAAGELGWRAAVGRGAGLDDGATGSVWVVLSRDDAVVQTLVDDSGWSQLDRDDPVRWTDDYSSLVAVLR
ncbi:MAG: spermidine synthase, partial [Nocardioidaceae bacterium]